MQLYLRTPRFARRAAATLMGAVLLASSMSVTAGPARAHHQELTWDEDGSTFATFGANAAVTISLGFIDYACDGFFATSDIYIVDAPPVAGEGLVDVAGLHNTVFGATGGLFSDTIAFTQPSGPLGPGTYTVVYDECQDGTFDLGVDAVFPDAFEVVLPAEIPPLDPAIATVKDAARAQALRWRDTIAAYDLLLNLEKLEIVLKCVTLDPTACVDAFATDVVVQGLGDLLPGVSALSPVERVKAEAKDAASDMFKHWEAIAADPPDPDFDQVTTLDPISPFSLEGAPLDRAAIRFGRAAATQAAIGEALLHSMERYQGADAAGDGGWALVHARAIQRYAVLLSDQVRRTTGAVADLRDQVAADPRDVDAMTAFTSAERARILADGFRQEELAMMASLGMDPAAIHAAVEAIAGYDPSIRTKAEMDDAFARLIAADDDTVAELRALAASMAGIVADLEADPAVSDGMPTASAGGPYAATLGAPLDLDAGASRDPDGTLTSVGWDIDGDGSFDDAAGGSPAVAASILGEGLVGVRVVDDEGNVAVDYALLVITGPNRAPVVTAVDPADRSPVIVVGQDAVFGVTADDPDGDPVSFAWRVDGRSVAGGVSMDFLADAAAVGPHLVEVVVSDGRPGGKVTHRWSPRVRHPDADADRWAANTDCDDTDGSVHPMALEIPGNGIDDDCSIATIDGGIAGDALVLPITVRDFRFDHPDFEDAIGVDRGIVRSIIGADRKPVYAPAGSSPTTSGRDNFDQWYRDVDGVNIAIPRELTFNRIPGSDVYRVEHPSFFPIDGLGWGNEGQGANYAFTVEGHSTFTYRGGERFEFVGDDDVWVFINDHLVIDLGGVHPAEHAVIELDAIADAIGITPGHAYAFDFFSAERHTTGSTLIADTSIRLADPSGPLTVSVDSTPSLARASTWTLEHTSTPDRIDLFDGETGAARLTVRADRVLQPLTARSAGEVCIDNATAAATQGLTVRLAVHRAAGPDGAPLASADVDTGADPVISPGARTCYPFVVDLPSDLVHGAQPLVIEVTVDTAVDHVFGRGVARSVLPSVPDGIGDPVVVDVADGRTLQVAAGGQVTYDVDVACPADAGPQSFEATVRGTGTSATTSVVVDCHELTVATNLATLLRTTHAWEVTKAGDVDALVLARDQAFRANYTVGVSDRATSDGLARGSLVVRNPAPIPARIESIDQSIGGVPADVRCSVVLPTVLEPGAAMACSFDLVVDDPSTDRAVLDVQRRDHHHAWDGRLTAAGTTTVEGTAPIDFAAGPSTVLDRCVTVDDSLRGALGTACAGVAPTVYAYALDFGPYTSSTAIENVATATAADTGTRSTATWSIAITIPEDGCTLTIGYWKTHAGSGPQRDMVTARLPIWLGSPGGSTSVRVTTARQAIEVLQMSGDASNGINRLLAQLLAARLNLLVGASPTAITSVLASADPFLATHAASSWRSLSKRDQRSVTQWAETLDRYNRGVIGPGHCSE